MFGLNLHHSDLRTNPEQQAIPTGWIAEIGPLENQLYAHTLEVCETFAVENLYSELITIGNEIPAGMLWSTGSYENPENLAHLLHAAARAVRRPSLGGHTKVVIHLAHGYDDELQYWFYDLVFNIGYISLDDWDVIAVSFYLSWGEDATMDALTASLTSLATQYR
ncbi:family 53 glycosyl hydrolase [Aspergillus pseudoustus]|uniref:Arabinogalactan endo-beta-1,4-galactanase n=1 Tax=Aspergillus pseudoustus TaxID=1810923 RepID=A0ABR4J3U0_9EURO